MGAIIASNKWRSNGSDKRLLHATDRAARRTKKNRSALVRDALREHLRKLEVRSKEERDRHGYSRRPHASDAIAMFACGYQAASYNSCRNRHCPKCQAKGRERWMVARERELLDKVPLSRDCTDEVCVRVPVPALFPLSLSTCRCILSNITDLPQNPDPCSISGTRPAARYGTE